MGYTVKAVARTREERATQRNCCDLNFDIEISWYITCSGVEFTGAERVVKFSMRLVFIDL